MDDKQVPVLGPPQYLLGFTYGNVFGQVYEKVSINNHVKLRLSCGVVCIFGGHTNMGTLDKHTKTKGCV